MAARAPARPAVSERRASTHTEGRARNVGGGFCKDWPIAESTDTPNGHDVEEGDEDAETGFERWRRESALGAVGTGIAKGLQNVFAPTDEHQVIVAEVPGDPPDASERVRVILDPDDPTKAVAYVPKAAEPEGAESTDAGREDAGPEDASPPEEGQAGADPAG